MSDYRIERARIRLSHAIDGLDPNANIDAVELCWIDPSGIDANSSGATPLQEFYAADFRGWQEDKWFPAHDGLDAVRKLLAYYKRILEDGVDPLGRTMPVIQENIEVLNGVAAVLETADDANVHFCFAVSD